MEKKQPTQELSSNEHIDEQIEHLCTCNEYVEPHNCGYISELFGEEEECSCCSYCEMRCLQGI